MTSVVVVPCLAVERPQLREAWRSLVAAGHLPGPAPSAASDVVVGEVLWLARALPLVVDILSSLDLYSVRFERAFVEIDDDDLMTATPSKRPLALVAWRRDDELFVEVLVVPAHAVDDGTVVDSVLARVVFPFRLVASLPGDEDITAEDLKLARDEPVRVRRFSVGKS